MENKLSYLQEMAKNMIGKGKETPSIAAYKAQEINSIIRVSPAFFIFKPWLLISTGALENLKENELQYLVAHEIGHLKSNKVWYFGIFNNIARTLIGSFSFLFLFYDIPEEEKKADLEATEFLYKEKGLEAVKGYCGFLKKVEKFNSMIGMDISNYVVYQRGFGISGRSPKKGNGSKKYKDFIKKILFQIKNNVILIINVALLNKSILFLHPSVDNRVEAINARFGLQVKSDL